MGKIEGKRRIGNSGLMMGRMWIWRCVGRKIEKVSGRMNGERNV